MWLGEEIEMRKFLGLAVLLALAAGCATPTPGGSASPAGGPSLTAPSPSPSQSLSPDQAAALAALDGYQATKDALFEAPAKYSAAEARAMLAAYTGYTMMAANLDALSQLRKSGDRFSSGPATVWVKVSDVVDNHNERGLEVHITVCHDKTAIQRLDKSGAVLGAPAEKFGVRQFSVRKPGKTWRVFGETASTGECHR